MAHARWISIGAALMASAALTACGGASSAPPAADTPVLQASFGSPSPGAIGTTTDTVVVRIVNYSSAAILDAGIRAFGSTAPHGGRLSGHNPATFGNGNQGGAFWVVLGVGSYEGFLDTDHGRLEFRGHVPAVRLPDGSYTAGPADLYLFQSDFGAPGGGGGPIIPGR